MCTSCWRKLTPLAHDKASERQWPSAISSQIGISENIELVEIICSHESALHIHKSPYKIERRRALHGRPFSALQSTILQLEMCSACRGLLSFATWHLVFSKIVSNKLQINVKNKITVICAKFGTDMINICDVTSRKTKWPHFLCTSLYLYILCCVSLHTRAKQTVHSALVDMHTQCSGKSLGTTQRSRL